MSQALNVNGQNDFNTEVLSAPEAVLVDFWAPWCMPCRMMAPILDELAVKMAGKVKIVKVDTENPENGPLAMAYNIQSIPNMKLFKDGKVVGEFIGLRDLNTLSQEITDIIG